MTDVAIANRALKPATRCAYCHGDTDARIRPCVTCGALLHPECWLTAGKCPTLGCRIVVRRTGAQTSGPAPAPRWTRRRLGWLALQVSVVLGFVTTTAGALVYALQPDPPERVLNPITPPPQVAADRRFRATLAFEEWFVDPQASLSPTVNGLNEIDQGARTFEDSRLLAFGWLVQGNRRAAVEHFRAALAARPDDPYTIAWLISLDAPQDSVGLEPAWLAIVRRAARADAFDEPMEQAFMIHADVERCLALVHLALLAEVRGHDDVARFLYKDAASVEGDATRFWQHRFAVERVRRMGLRD